MTTPNLEVVKSFPLIIPTERPNVVLSRLTLPDAPHFFDAWQNSAKDIAEFDPVTSGKYSTIEEVESSLAEQNRIRMGVWDNGKFVAGTSLRPTEKEGVWLLGYWTDSRYTGKGYSSLAATAISRVAKIKIPTVQAEVMEENVRSIRILEKAGFKNTGAKVGAFSIFELLK